MKGNIRLHKPSIRYHMCRTGKRSVDLARALDVNESQLSRAVNGYHGVNERTAAALARELGVTPEDITAPTAERRMALAMGAA